MAKGRVITEEAKYNFLALIKTLGHPSVRLDKELGLPRSLYDMFLTGRSVRNRYSRSVILYLLDFGMKCNLSEALILQNSLLEYCTRRAMHWEPLTFPSEDSDAMIASMELKFTDKLTMIIHKLHHNTIDINPRLKHLLTNLNEVYLYSFIHLFVYLFMRLFVYSFICLFVYLFIHLHP